MLVCKLGLITNNNILDNSDRGIAWLLGDLDGFLLGFPVGTSAGVLVGKSEDRPTNTTTEEGSKSEELYYLIALLFKRIKF